MVSVLVALPPLLPHRKMKMMPLLSTLYWASAWLSESEGWTPCGKFQCSQMLNAPLRQVVLTLAGCVIEPSLVCRSAGHDLPFVVRVPPYLHELEALAIRYQSIDFCLGFFDWSTRSHISKWMAG